MKKLQYVAVGPPMVAAVYQAVISYNQLPRGLSLISLLTG